MGERSDQIEQHIQGQRNELGEHIGELQERVKRAIDWRAQFQERPMTMIGVAFGGGALLSALLRNKPRRHRGSTRERPRDERPSDFEANDSRKSDRTSDTWENIKGAVVGVAATRFGSFLEQVVPGFDEEYRKRAGKSLSESAGI
jgi:hypothetical protein